jgi:hypothetical protein
MTASARSPHPLDHRIRSITATARSPRPLDHRDRWTAASLDHRVA